MGQCPEFGQAGQLSGNLLDRAVRTSLCRALGNDNLGWGTRPPLPTQQRTMLSACRGLQGTRVSPSPAIKGKGGGRGGGSGALPAPSRALPEMRRAEPGTGQDGLGGAGTRAGAGGEDAGLGGARAVRGQGRAVPPPDGAAPALSLPGRGGRGLKAATGRGTAVAAARSGEERREGC